MGDIVSNPRKKGANPDFRWAIQYTMAGLTDVVTKRFKKRAKAEREAAERNVTVIDLDAPGGFMRATGLVRASRKRRVFDQYDVDLEAEALKDLPSVDDEARARQEGDDPWKGDFI